MYALRWPLTLLLSLLSFALAYIIGRVLIPWLRKEKIGQEVRELGPKTHYAKSGTPTFGGLIFLLPTLLLGGFVAWSFPFAKALFGILIFTLGMAAIGFADDYIKVRINKEGLSAFWKTVPMLLLCVLLVLWYLRLPSFDSALLVPFSHYFFSIHGWGKLPYGLLLVIYLYYITNSVNLTDGVDGLLGTLCLPVAAVLGLGAVILQRPGTAGYTSLMCILVAALLAFLCFNRHPARIFMGDTGSLALGGLLSAMAMFLASPWVFLLLGFIFCAESLSVIIQRAYFRRTGGKRIFRMSPIHHHYELGGWSEPQIVWRFTLVTLLGAVLTLLSWYAFIS